MEAINKIEMGKRIKQIRKLAGLRQWQLAQILGTTQSAVHKYEHGVIPEPRRLVRLARIGNTSIEWILVGEHWENGSNQQERVPLDVFRLAERLRALGPDARRTLDEALRILGEAAEALKHGRTGELGGPQFSEAAPGLTDLKDKPQQILAAALRVHRAILDSVLDLAEERLSSSPLASEPLPASHDTKGR